MITRITIWPGGPVYRPYEELTEAFARINPRLAGLHQEARPVLLALPPGTPFEMPEAILIPTTVPSLNGRRHRLWCQVSLRHLQMWSLAMSICPGIKPVSTWRPSRWITTIPSYWRLVRRSRLEAFHVDWGIDAGAGPQRLVLSMVPPKAYRKDHTSRTRAQLCRLTNSTCEPIPETVAHYLGTETPRIVAEVAVPGVPWA